MYSCWNEINNKKWWYTYQLYSCICTVKFNKFYLFIEFVNLVKTDVFFVYHVYCISAVIFIFYFIVYIHLCGVNIVVYLKKRNKNFNECRESVKKKQFNLWYVQEHLIRFVMCCILLLFVKGRVQKYRYLLIV